MQCHSCCFCFVVLCTCEWSVSQLQYQYMCTCYQYMCTVHVPVVGQDMASLTFSCFQVVVWLVSNLIFLSSVNYVLVVYEYKVMTCNLSF